MHIVGQFQLKLIERIETTAWNKLRLNHFESRFSHGIVVRTPFHAQRAVDPETFKQSINQCVIEFDNTLIDGLLESFRIDRSLSMKGCPYDNAVAESTFKMIKAEFVSCRRFDTLDQLQLELADYVHWFNNIRLHGTLSYLSPAEFKRSRTL